MSFLGEPSYFALRLFDFLAHSGDAHIASGDADSGFSAAVILTSGGVARPQHRL
jgi:hypothetical protein